MTLRSMIASIGLVTVLSQGPAHAVEIKVFVASAFMPVHAQIGPEFERASGHKLAVTTAVGGILRKRIAGGESFDLAILDTPDLDDLIKQRKVASSSRANIARAGIGVGIRKGAPRPDISSVDAFKRTLLAAKSISYAEAGASATHFISLLDRLGIAEALKTRLLPRAGTGAVEAVIKGEAELAIIPIPPIIGSPDLDLVGPLPSDLQLYIGFSGGLAASTGNAEAARGLIEALSSPAAAKVIKSNGMEPGIAPGQ